MLVNYDIVLLNHSLKLSRNSEEILGLLNTNYKYNI